MRTPLVATLAAFFVALLTANAAATLKYGHPEKIRCKISYCDISAPYLNRWVKWGEKPLSDHWAASDDLPFGTKIFVPYWVTDRKGRRVKKTIFRIIADRPKARPSYTKVEPYLHPRYIAKIGPHLSGWKMVTVIRPI